MVPSTVPESSRARIPDIKWFTKGVSLKITQRYETDMVTQMLSGGSMSRSITSATNIVLVVAVFFVIA